MNTRTLDWTALAVTIVGGLNWLLVGLFQFDLIAALFGGITAGASRFLYTIVGLASLYSLTLFNKLDDREDRDTTVHRKRDIAIEDTI
jgi:uncharacterized membrane protein YuzA (DUF378 family)